MNRKFVVTPKKETITITIRTKPEYNKKLEEIAAKSGRSRNDIINMALKFALDNLEFIDNNDK